MPFVNLRLHASLLFMIGTVKTIFLQNFFLKPKCSAKDVVQFLGRWKVISWAPEEGRGGHW